MTSKPPTPTIERAHKECLGSLPLDDTTDFDDTDRGLIATLAPCVIKAADGRVVWDNDAYSFLDGDAPTSVHPSLWRQSTLAAKQGLYQVVEGIYQVRGFDLSNVSFVETDNGVIVVDPLISTEVAAAALKFYREHRGGERPVVAVIYTHSHVDHFGGVLGVTSQEDVDSGKVSVLAPEGFIEHAVQENVYAGTAMTRRATYMYGTLLARGPQGQVGCGLGPEHVHRRGFRDQPDHVITTTGDKHTIDGLEIEFQMAPGTEAPAEMHFYFPRYRALCMAENATHNLHNLLTLRGALVRDPHVWSGYLTEAIDRFTDDVEVAFASHHWPTWGRRRIVEFLSTQRDLYAYLHDQTLRLLNQGYTGAEIAEQFQMPPALEKAWHTHGYYGSVSHNVKAVYQRYMGWFDGNPARLWPHPPEALAKRYVDAIGGLDRVVEHAQKAFDEGDFRWAATLLDHAAFTDADHPKVCDLYADTLEQLGYGAENATWRNFFLSGATELRDGNFGSATSTASSTMLSQLTPEQMFDTLATSVNGPRAWDLDLAIDITFSDIDTNYRLTLRNGVLVYRLRAADESTANTTVRLDSKLRLLMFAAGRPHLAGHRRSRRRRRAAGAARGTGRPESEVQYRDAVGPVRRTIDWEGDAVTIIDQTALPSEYRIITLRTVDELVDAIRRLAVRGAPALGAAGALGVVLAVRAGGDVRVAAERVARTRPTAVNLSWGVTRALEKLDEGPDAVLATALEILDEDERLNRAASAHAAEIILGLCGRRPLRLLTHCNAGHLATVAWGSAARRRLAPARTRAGRVGTGRRDTPAAAGLATHRVGAGAGWCAVPRPARRCRRGGDGVRAWSTACSSAPIGSRPTATSPTRSAPTAWPSRRIITTCHSSSSRPRPPSTPHWTRAPKSSSRNARPTSSGSSAGPRSPRRTRTSSTRPST